MESDLGFIPTLAIMTQLSHGPGKLHISLATKKITESLVLTTQALGLG